MLFFFGGNPSLVIAQPSSIVVFSVESLEAIEIILSNLYETCAEKVVKLEEGRTGEDSKSTVLRVLIPSREYASFITASN